MRDEQHGHAAFGLFGKEKVGNLPARLPVEIACRFVGDEKRGRGGKSTGDRHALLFAAGKLAGIMRQPLAEPHRDQFLARNVEGLRLARKFQRYRDIFERRHVGDQVKGLEDNADIAAAEGRRFVFRHAVKGSIRNEDFAAVDPFEPRHHHQERGLAGPRRPDDADRAAPGDFEVDALQHMHGDGRKTKRQVCLFQADDGFGHENLPYISRRPGRRECRMKSNTQFRKMQMRFKAFLAILLAATLSMAASASQAAAKTLHIVAFGDSLMAGYQLPAEDAFPAKLEAALKARGYDVSITNASVSGDTTADGLARADWSIPDGTDGVIVELGANDALRGLSPEETRKNLEAILSRLKTRKIPVLIAGMQAPPNLGAEYATRFNAIYPDLAKEYGAPLYPLFVKAYALDPTLKLDDGMHPNAKGVDAAVKDFLPVAVDFVKALQAR